MLGRPNESEGSNPATDSPARRTGLGIAARYGFRRVEQVHIRVNNGFITATVTGVAHRYPHSVPVSLSVANRFVAAGAPLSVERIDPPTPSGSRLMERH